MNNRQHANSPASGKFGDGYQQDTEVNGYYQENHDGYYFNHAMAFQTSSESSIGEVKAEAGQSDPPLHPGLRQDSIMPNNGSEDPAAIHD
ncbi:hypothetical protein PG994_001404 [Apiospora phragmitis]|uniref:Uncharacterized protein n=1 Tax=Apiospora phragmitis TaxID=2905665 RepID=A0ABR1WTF4_9PEZI